MRKKEINRKIMDHLADSPYEYSREIEKIGERVAQSWLKIARKHGISPQELVDKICEDLEFTDGT